MTNSRGNWFTSPRGGGGLIVLATMLGMVVSPSGAGFYVVDKVTFNHWVDKNVEGNADGVGLFLHEELSGLTRARAQCRSWVDPGGLIPGVGWDAWADVEVGSQVCVLAKWRGGWFGGNPQGLLTAQCNYTLWCDAQTGGGMSESAQATSRCPRMQVTISWPDGPGEIRHAKSFTEMMQFQVRESCIFFETSAVVAGNASRIGDTGKAEAGDTVGTNPDRPNLHEMHKSLSPIGTGF